MSRASDLQATPELCIELSGGQGFICPNSETCCVLQFIHLPARQAVRSDECS